MLDRGGERLVPSPADGSLPLPGRQRGEGWRQDPVEYDPFGGRQQPPGFLTQNLRRTDIHQGLLPGPSQGGGGREPLELVGHMTLVAELGMAAQRRAVQAPRPERLARVSRELAETGLWKRPSQYADEPYLVTRQLIEDGRNNLLLGATIETGCPVRILQGVEDPDVPWQHAKALVARLACDDVVLTLIKDGDHRLSRPEDIERLIAAVAEF